MYFSTGNKKAIHRLSIRSLKANRLRNIMASIAIALTTILFTSVFTIGLGMKASMEESTFRMVGGYAHGSFKDLTPEQYDKIKTHPRIKESGETVVIGIAANEVFLKNPTEVRYTDENTSVWMYLKIQTGRAPTAVNEVALDTTTLKQLGLTPTLGIEVPLEIQIGTEIVRQNFILTGYWERAQGIQVGQIRVAEALARAVQDNLTDDVKVSGIGRQTMDVMLQSSYDIEKQIAQIAIDSGYMPDGVGENAINVGTNWAYMNARGVAADPMIILAIIGACLLIMFTGYLIIYNVFQISVMADIRFYGLLKTIGTTPRQIKTMINRQAMYLSLVGIPVGLLIGYGIGNALLPVIIGTMNVEVSCPSIHPSIFVGASLFSLVTVWVSCYKPGSVAASQSPIEASKYVDVQIDESKHPRRFKQMTSHMAYGNIMRQKKKTAIVILSLSLSLVLLNSVYTYTQGFDLEKYLSRQVVSDFVLGSANYFNVNQGFRSQDDTLTATFREEVSRQQGVTDVSTLYYDIYLSQNKMRETWVQFYGIESGIRDRLEVVEGSIDQALFESGDYVLATVYRDDYGKIIEEFDAYQIGDEVTLKTLERAGEEKTYKVMAKVDLPHNASVRFSIGNSQTLLTSMKEFLDYVEAPLAMAGLVEVEEGYEEAVQNFIESYTTNVEPRMSYESRARYEEDFKGTKQMYLTVGIVASFIIGLIGIGNFVNAIMTSILTRRGEFAILQSIGMTTAQLRKMLVLEGILYASITGIVASVLSIVCSLLIVRPIGGQLWFFTYQFEVLPLLVIVPCLVVLGAWLPRLIHQIVGKQSIVERLRKID